MEIELRARLPNGPRLLKSVQTDDRLVKIGVTNEDDKYFRHKCDLARKLILRIRRCGKSASLTFKGKAKNTDTAWPDVDLVLDKPDELEKLLTVSGYVPVIRIQKKRWSFRFRDLEMNIDRVRGLGWFIEIEARGNNKQRRILETKIERALYDLGITQASIIRQGYVPLALANNK